MRHLALGLLAATALFWAQPAHAGTFKGHIGTYQVTFDPRDCISPLCGGFWVDAVNHRDQNCPDGTVAATCYVADIDYAAMGWTSQDWSDYLAAAGANTILIKGSLTLKSYSGTWRLGFMTPTKAWVQWLPAPKP